MNLLRPSHKVLRSAFAAALVTAALAASLPTAAQAAAGDINVTATVVNQTTAEFSVNSYTVTEGVNDVPPNATIPAGTSDWFRTKSDTATGGTRGEIQYQVPKGVVKIRWNNPYDGTGSYTCIVPDTLQCSKTVHGDDAKANVKFTVSE
jgi:hypothetical protein